METANKYLKKGLHKILSSPKGYEWKGVKWDVLDYDKNKVLLGAYKNLGKVGKFFAGKYIDDKFVSKWVSVDFIKKGLKSGEIKEIK